jgi:hypothetical protein
MYYQLLLPLFFFNQRGCTLASKACLHVRALN